MAVTRTQLREPDAVNHVLGRLGYGVCSLLKSGLNNYGIELDRHGSTCNFEDIFYVLKELVGVEAAQAIMQEIYIELDALSSK